LSLKAEGRNGKSISLKNFAPGELITLDSNNADSTPFDGVQVSKLSISGQVDKAVKGFHKSENKLELRFTPLKQDGQPISVKTP
jgi:hypothetical protein